MEGSDHVGLRLPELPALVQAANEQAHDLRLYQSTLPDFISAVRRDLPAPTSNGESLGIVHGELRSPKRHHLLSGVLSTRMWIKQRNDACELALTRYAEPMAAMSRWLGGRDRRAEFQQSWRYFRESPPRLDFWLRN